MKEKMLLLEIKDNGRGFDPARKGDGRKGIGLYTIRERVELMGGILKDKQYPGQRDGFIYRGAGRMIRVIVADDHIIFRQGLLKLLQSAEGITVAGEAGDGKEALAMIVKESPDIAVLDISMPGLSGIEISKELKARGCATKVVYLTMHNDVLTAKKALTSGGVSGYILKDDAFEDLLYAIKSVSSGGKFISPSISDKILQPSPLRRWLKKISSPSVSGKF